MYFTNTKLEIIKNFKIKEIFEQDFFFLSEKENPAKMEEKSSTKSH